MSFTTKDVEKVAKLARIRLTDEEKTHLTHDLTKILDWIEMLQEVNTDDEDEMTSVTNATLALHEDKVSDGNIKEQVLKNAPESKYDCYEVPKVVE